MKEFVTYATPEEAEVWHRLRCTPAWPAPNGSVEAVEADARLVERKLAALVRASDWLDARIRWKGEKVDPGQSRAWPRVEMGSGTEGIPIQVRQACCELAAHFMEADHLAPQERGGRILSTSVDCLAVTYDPNAPVDTLFPLVSGLLRDLREPGGLEPAALNLMGLVSVEAGRG